MPAPCPGCAFLVLLIAGIAPALGTLGLLVCAGAFAFLYWNWHPARVFLGDVSSVPMGYLMGWLLLALAGEGAWAAAVILPLVYLADTTLTLPRRPRRAGLAPIANTATRRPYCAASAMTRLP